jgi:hypothetical protein
MAGSVGKPRGPAERGGHLPFGAIPSHLVFMFWGRFAGRAVDPPVAAGLESYHQNPANTGHSFAPQGIRSRIAFEPWRLCAINFPRAWPMRAFFGRNASAPLRSAA